MGLNGLYLEGPFSRMGLQTNRTQHMGTWCCHHETEKGDKSAKGSGTEESPPIVENLSKQSQEVSEQSFVSLSKFTKEEWV